MVRDLTMIFSVLVSLLSLGFGVYKNIEAGNAKGFAYEQAYRVMGAVQDAPGVSDAAKASILNGALEALATPPPVVDLSRSAADEPSAPQTCEASVKAACADLAAELAAANVACGRSKDVSSPECAHASQTKAAIVAQSCVVCF